MARCNKLPRPYALAKICNGGAALRFPAWHRRRAERSERQEVIAAHHGVDEGDVGGVGGTRVFGNPRSEVSNESITSSSVHVRILQGVLER